jgi:hypothetical protein
MLREVYAKVFKLFNPDSPVPDVSISFYPYVNVNHTIRVRDGRVLVKISTLFREAPAAVHEALAIILVAKLLRRRVPAKADLVYKNFVSDPDFRALAISHKQKKGRKQLHGSKGEAYDLEEIFDQLNRDYFNQSLIKPKLSWSGGKTFRRLGHYDEAHNAIVISRSLDSRSIPAFVVEYVVYHEMLHVKHPTVHRNGKRYSHTPEFKRDEQRYDYFEEADGWIERNAADLKEIAGGKRAGKSHRNYWGLFD